METAKATKLEISKLLKLKRKAKRITEDRTYLSADLFFNPIIYFLYQDKTVVYIGCSMEGIQRVSSHTRTKEFKEFDSWSVELHRGKSKKQLMAIEASLIRKFQPKYNILNKKT